MQVSGMEKSARCVFKKSLTSFNLSATFLDCHVMCETLQKTQIEV